MSDELDIQDNDLPELPGGAVAPPTKQDTQQSGTEGDGKGGASSSPDRTAKLEAALADLAGHVKEVTKPKEQPRQKTQDEINAEWAVYNPEAANPKFFHELFGLGEDADPKRVEQIKQLFGNMQGGLVKQAIIGARNLFQAELDKRDAIIKELQGFTQEQSAKELRSEFNSSYPVFGDKKYNKILKIASDDLAEQNFADRDAYFKALAERAAEYIRDYNPEFDLGAKPNQTKQPGQTLRLPRTSVGGSGGAGGGSAGGAKSSGDDVDSLG